MPQHEVRGDRAVYDHEIEDPRAGRRRRTVADWGVGEELFDRMPSPRRRFRADAPAGRRDRHPRERRAEPAEDVVIATAPAPEPARKEAPRREPARDEAPRREPALDEAPRHEPTPGLEPRRKPAPAPAQLGVAGRRTVVIGGQASAARRPRPQRTVGERLGPRPDRIAAYAVALGLLLIVIAFLSS